MKNRWDPGHAGHDPLAQCAYGSRLIGADASLVLHGGGNTSVKAPFRDVTGAEVDALYVKGSGWDLATILPAGFAPLRLARLRELLTLDALSDEEMMRELLAARLDPSAPAPSVESLLHALLPHTAVLHSHADVVVTLTNLGDGARTVREVYGERVVIVPYVMPGFDLAKAVAALWPEHAAGPAVGLVLLHHGLFTFGDDTETAYARHVELITTAEAWLRDHAPMAVQPGPALPPPNPAQLARLRRDLSVVAGKPMIVSRHADDTVARFVARPDLGDLARRGPLTPDHVIRTKRVPLVGTDVAAYAAEYRSDFARLTRTGPPGLKMLDPAPRIVLDPAVGMLAAGDTPRAARIAADIYHHTIPVLERAEDHLGGYRALPEEDVFAVEYWDLEQAKLRRAGPAPEMAGMVAVVTGAASGIGRACAAELRTRGAAVAAVDIAEQADADDDPGWLRIRADVTDADAQAEAVAHTVARFGGVDIVVVSAGVFGAGGAIADLDPAEWRRMMAVNVDAVADLFRLAHPLLALSPVGGRAAVVASKNVAAPGPGAAAYSASKAALTQLARVAALEWAADGIRVNVVHPDAVFDTGLWDDDTIAARAARYGITSEDYMRRNLLGMEITSRHVARVVADLCSDDFAATTGAQVPVDGGNERVI